MEIPVKTKTVKNPQMSEPEAVFSIFMSVIYADGKMSDAEINEFSYFFSKIKLFKNLTITNLFGEFQKLFKQLDYNPQKVVELACPFVTTDNRLPVYMYCCDFIYSNDVEKQYEIMLLQSIMEGLTLDEKISENVAKLMKRKNQL
jgi:hypothetical protein